jgi:small-conductance mechanosensitive channel
VIGLPEEASGLAWQLLLIIGYPLLTVAILEVERGFRDRQPLLASTLRQFAYILLPSAAMWLILQILAGVPQDNVAVRLAKTLFWVSSLYLALRFVQAVTLRIFDEEKRAPKLLLDLGRGGLSLLGGAVIVSDIWHVDLRSLVAAMGVGSIVLGFALQDFLGNLLSGLSLLSAHKFGIGDWLVVNNQPSRVVEMDWRTVTLVNSSSARTIVANSSLAKGNLTIAARARELSWAEIGLSISVSVPPEDVRRTALEVAQAITHTGEQAKPKCLITELGIEVTKYTVLVPVANPGAVSGKRDEFLSQFWYLSQRRGVRLGNEKAPPMLPDVDARLRMLEMNSALRRNQDVLLALAQAATFRRYRRGEVLLPQGAPSHDVLLVVSGTLGTYMSNGDSQVRVELVGVSQLLAMKEMLDAGPSPLLIMAEWDANVLAIPGDALSTSFKTARLLARDVGALMEARRQAVVALRRVIRDAA